VQQSARGNIHDVLAANCYTATRRVGCWLSHLGTPVNNHHVTRARTINTTQ